MKQTKQAVIPLRQPSDTLPQCLSCGTHANNRIKDRACLQSVLQIRIRHLTFQHAMLSSVALSQMTPSKSKAQISAIGLL
jgi:hypothetical protein